jgi:membrane-associated phospholipid phosphatase
MMEELTARTRPAESFLTLRGYRLVDYMTQAYVAAVGLIILLFHGRELPHWPLLAAGHAMILVAAHALIQCSRRSRSGFVHMLRAFYPMILYTFLYCETHELDGLFYNGYLDGFVIDLDQIIFGSQLSRTLMARWPHLWLSEVLYVFYFSYYVMVLSVGLGMYFKEREHFWEYITIVSFLFFVCYLTYIFLPVMGPHGTRIGVVFSGRLASVGPRSVPGTLDSGFFYRLMAVIYRLVEPEGGAAFPSSHVVVAVATLWFTWRYFRPARWLHTLAVIMLCISTVYCGYHYAADVLAGLATAGLCVPLAVWMFRRWGGRPPEEAEAE